MNYIDKFTASFLLLSLLISMEVMAEDWPTYLRNNQRNAVTEEKIVPPLSEVWVQRAAWPPQPAWGPAANQDFYHAAPSLDERSDFDRAFQVVVAGDSLFYASPSNHAVYAVDIASGKVRWKFLAEGPVRMAPSIYNGKVYFGCDDGCVYCLDGQGKLLWKFRVASADQRLPGNGHMISLWPIRSGVMIEDQKGYACAGLFPTQVTFRCAFDPETGKVVWNESTGLVYDGYLTAAGESIIAPSGRIGPQAFIAADGKNSSVKFPNAAGTYIFASGNQTFFQTGRYKRALAVNVGSKPMICDADYAVCRGGILFLHGRKEISAIPLDTVIPLHVQKTDLSNSLDAAKKAKKTEEINDLQKKIDDLDKKIVQANLWTVKLPAGAKDVSSVSYSLILAGDILFTGRDGQIAAISTKGGKEIWNAKVTGKVYSLAAANGRLFASTDSGTIHCFAAEKTAAKQEVNLALKPASSPAPAGTAEKVKKILSNTPERKGYCLILGQPDEEMLTGLAQMTEFRIVAAASDSGQAASLRSSLDEKGYHGQIAIHEGKFETLPYPPYFANLVILNPGSVTQPDEIWRVLQPYGGIAVTGDGSPIKALTKELVPFGGEFVGQNALKRGPLPGAGEWTHHYCTPANGAASYDPYVRGKLAPLWFGDPGPREMIDRHNRTMSPLFKDGRLFIPANEKIIAINAYNGQRLWDLDVPGSRRVGALKDSGHMAVGDDTVYIVVKDECWTVQAANGKRQTSLRLPSGDASQPRSWGYLAVVGENILGTIEAGGASFGEHKNMCPILEGDFKSVICSRSLFCLDRKTGAARWHYQKEKGAILNSGIAVDDGTVFFLESRNDDASAGSKNGRTRIDSFVKAPCFLVALDLVKGTKKWEQSVELPYQHILYLQCADKMVLAIGTFNKKAEAEKVCYSYYAFSEETGKPVWQGEYPTALAPKGEHGEQWQHPVIIGQEAFTKYFACNIGGGAAMQDYKPGAQGNCGTWAGSVCAVFTRGGGFDLDTLSGIPYGGNNRTGCFINIVPAGGILSMPESSAGCTCDFAIQASMAYYPVDRLSPVIYPLNRKFTDRVTVSIQPNIKDAIIRYTLDGSEPNEKSPLYEKPFELTAPTTVKAILWDTTNVPGKAVSAKFVSGK